MSPRTLVGVLMAAAVMAGCGAPSPPPPPPPPVTTAPLAPAPGAAASTPPAGAGAGGASSPAANTPTPPATEVVVIGPADLDKLDGRSSPHHGKTVEFTGELREVPNNGYYLGLKTDNEFSTYIAPLVQLGPGIKPPQTEMRARLAPTQTVTLHGVEKQNLDPAIDRKDWIWTLVRTGDNPSPILQAVDLTKEFAADRKAFAKKFEKRPVYVRGEVAELKFPSGFQDLGTITLRGSDGVELVCFVQATSKRYERKVVAVGDTVQIAGQFSEADGIGGDPTSFNLFDGDLIATPLPVPGVTYAATPAGAPASP